MQPLCDDAVATSFFTLCLKPSYTLFNSTEFQSKQSLIPEPTMATRDGGMKSTSINGVKMYTIASQQPSLASWLPSKKQNSHRNVKSNSLSLSVAFLIHSFILLILLYALLSGYTQNLQLLEDLRFATAATKIKATPDGEYIVASGIYPPQVKVYEVRELGLKFERHLDSEIVDFQVLKNSEANFI